MSDHEPTTASAAAEARAPYARVLQRIQARVEEWEQEAARLEYQAAHFRVMPDTRHRYRGRASGLRLCAEQVRKELGL